MCKRKLDDVEMVERYEGSHFHRFLFILMEVDIHFFRRIKIFYLHAHISYTSELKNIKDMSPTEEEKEENPTHPKSKVQRSTLRSS